MNITRSSCAALALTLAIGLTAMSSMAFAQAGTVDPKACANGAGTLPNQSLSEKLDQTNGVICPPNVDPGIKAPTPNAGKMPVIPPPGSPGGDPTVQPK
jgi:hypothetical protein